MKRNPDFLLSKIAGNFVLIPIGKMRVDFNGIISLNEMGVDIWNFLEQDISFDELIKKIMSEYEGIDEETVRKYCEEFLKVLDGASCILKAE